jgi:hypothetical protein
MRCRHCESGLAKTCRPAKEGADVNDQHDPGQLAAYAMGLLDGHEAQTTQAHITECPPVNKNWQILSTDETSWESQGVAARILRVGPAGCGLSRWRGDRCDETGRGRP